MPMKRCNIFVLFSSIFPKVADGSNERLTLLYGATLTLTSSILFIIYTCYLCLVKIVILGILWLQSVIKLFQIIKRLTASDKI